MNRFRSPFSFASATQYLVLTNILVYAIQVLLQSGQGASNSGGDLFSVFNLRGISWFEQIFALQAPPQSYRVVWQVVTFMFLHGGITHILFNMWALWLFGTALERVWGAEYFLKYYFVAGIGSGITVVLLSLISPHYVYSICQQMPMPLPDGCIPVTLGASGAIFGLLLAFGMLFPEQLIYLYFAVPIKAKYAVILFGGLEFFLTVGPNLEPGVSHIGHLGGILFGFIFLKGRSLVRRL
ncbi:rhomboid family intramembrane serine protease [Candidatus Acetothermia bacterium]|nr:rhomboid family intramembrane serine protease [Candidatus Acetothermia bacterium]MBI3643238.1 rhomboid family intramembrane serine protease [Candidatus Acetothermia bacterium]